MRRTNIEQKLVRLTILHCIIFLDVTIHNWSPKELIRVKKIKLSFSIVLIISLISLGSLCLSAQDDVVTIKYWNLFTGGDGAFMSQIV